MVNFVCMKMKLALLIAVVSASVTLSTAPVAASPQIAAGPKLDAPTSASIGEPFDVTLTAGDLDGAAGIDGIVSMPSVASFDALRANRDFDVLQIAVHDGAAFATFPSSGDGAGSPFLRFRVTPLRPGILHLTVDALRVAARDGSVLFDGSRAVGVRVGGGDTSRRARSDDLGPRQGAGGKASFGRCHGRRLDQRR